MKIILTLLSCSVIFQTTCSQDHSIGNTVNEKYAVSLAPAFFPQGWFGIQPGFQFRLTNHSSLMTEIALPITGNKYNSDGYDKMKFYKITSELKIFPKNSPIGRFGSIQLGYVGRNFEDKDSGRYHSENDTTMTGYSRISIKSPVFFCAVKMGGEMVQWKKIFMDFFIGIGIRVIPTKYNAEGSYIQRTWSPPKDFVLFEPVSAWEYDKTCIRPHFSLGFRIGRKF